MNPSPRLPLSASRPKTSAECWPTLTFSSPAAAQSLKPLLLKRLRWATMPLFRGRMAWRTREIWMTLSAVDQKHPHNPALLQQQHRMGRWRLREKSLPPFKQNRAVRGLPFELAVRAAASRRCRIYPAGLGSIGSSEGLPTKLIRATFQAESRVARFCAPNGGIVAAGDYAGLDAWRRWIFALF